MACTPKRAFSCNTFPGPLLYQCASPAPPGTQGWCNVEASYVFAEFELEGQRFELRKHGQRVPIQPKELRLLLYLVAHRGRVVSKAELLQALWPRETVCDDSIKRAVRGVRRALGDDGAKQSRIRTVRGYGYEFVPPVIPVGTHEPTLYEAWTLHGRARSSVSGTQASPALRERAVRSA